MFLRSITGAVILICGAYIALTAYEITTGQAVATRQSSVGTGEQLLLHSCIEGYRSQVRDRAKGVTDHGHIDEFVRETCACRVDSITKAAADIAPDDQIAQGVLREWAVTFFDEQTRGNPDIEQAMVKYTLSHPRQDILSEENIHRISRLISLHMNRCMATKAGQPLFRGCIEGIGHQVESRAKKISNYGHIDELIHETCACRVDSITKAAADIAPDDPIAQGVLREWAVTFFSEHIRGNPDIKQVMLEYTLSHPRQDILSEENIQKITRLLPSYLGSCIATFEGRLALVGQ